ncbi:MAG: MBL fold metallo-hydrolase [Gammaproteobacteria bacterium]|nr:MBL fold metallo-hydrolase [Gammaproteobacteria bacterium]
MKAEKFYSEGPHHWFIVYDQAESRVIDSNVYALQVDGSAVLCDPGGFEVFPQVFSALVDVMPPSSVTAAFVSHQDPDIASSLPLWNACNPNIVWHTSKLWVGFIRHYGALEANIQGIGDEGGEIVVGTSRLQIIPAHYLHSSANFHLYDPTARVLFSGDVGAALLPTGHSAFVDRRDIDTPAAFDAHIKSAEYFHKRWMPSNTAKNAWCERVSKLDIDFLCPQHGAIYTGKNVQRFIDWFAALDVGSANN